MSTATSPSRLAIAVAGLFIGGMVGVAAQSLPDSENGRYTMSPVADGVVRLDTRTGAVSTCNNTVTGWACYAVPDERAALDAEIGRLRTEIDKTKSELEKLKADLASREPGVSGKIEETLPKSDSLREPESKAAEGERKFEIPLPSDRDLDRVMSFLERAWRRLIEMANRVQKDVNGRI
jgi:hypothetical protein